MYDVYPESNYLKQNKWGKAESIGLSSNRMKIPNIATALPHREFHAFPALGQSPEACESSLGLAGAWGQWGLLKRVICRNSSY